MSEKLHIRTFGCQMNEYDTSKMADLLAVIIDETSWSAVTGPA